MTFVELKFNWFVIKSKLKHWKFLLIHIAFVSSGSFFPNLFGQGLWGATLEGPHADLEPQVADPSTNSAAQLGRSSLLLPIWNWLSDFFLSMLIQTLWHWCLLLKWYFNSKGGLRCFSWFYKRKRKLSQLWQNIQFVSRRRPI